ncbi:hypothetical protein Tco_0861064 [Tanacetum coccineum]|uniref:Uncharacterized protein n=1 Tax=Tanacetum coccineum TaxID=301880 RepID=A0ABQ5BJT6_9ASTR
MSGCSAVFPITHGYCRSPCSVISTLANILHDRLAGGQREARRLHKARIQMGPYSNSLALCRKDCEQDPVKAKWVGLHQSSYETGRRRCPEAAVNRSTPTKLRTKGGKGVRVDWTSESNISEQGWFRESPERMGRSGTGDIRKPMDRAPGRDWEGVGLTLRCYVRGIKNLEI